MTSDQQPSIAGLPTQHGSKFQYPVIVVDCETSDLDEHRGIAVEIAWWNLDTGERACFVPPHDTEMVLTHGDPVALAMNGYRERLLHRPHDDHDIEGRRLEGQLTNNTLAGANPRFDVGFLTKVISPVWHYRLWDLEAYAAGRLGLNYVPGLVDICQRLSIEPPDHTAEGDVTATGKCLLALVNR